MNDKINVAEDLAYSGTMAIARQATFWGVPAIGISRDAGGAPASADCGAIANLLRVLWEGRTEWSGPGLWLSLNLPARLPAPLVQARVGRDKIGAACETLESTAESFAFRLARGRPGTSTEGDERAVVTAGGIAPGAARLVRRRADPTRRVELGPGAALSPRGPRSRQPAQLAGYAAACIQW